MRSHEGNLMDRSKLDGLARPLHRAADQVHFQITDAQPDRFAVLGAPGLVAVGAAEDQAAFHRVQLGQAPALLGRGDVALDPGLEGPARGAAALGPGQGPLGPLARLIQQAVQHIDVSLFGADGIRRTRRTRGDGIGLARRHIS